MDKLNEISTDGLNEIDKEFLFLIVKGYSSSYQIWNFIGKNPDLNLKIKPMAYNNVNKRVLSVYKKGYLEEVKLDDKSNIHGRRDYKLSPKGLDFLIVNGLLHPNDSKLVTEYLDRFPNDMQHLTHILILRMRSIIAVAEFYGNYQGGKLFISQDLRRINITSPKKEDKNIQKLYSQPKLKRA